MKEQQILMTLNDNQKIIMLIAILGTAISLHMFFTEWGSVKNSYLSTPIVTFFDYGKEKEYKATPGGFTIARLGSEKTYINYTYGIHVPRESSYILSVMLGMIVPFLLIAFTAFLFFGEFNGVVLIRKFRNKISQTKPDN